MGHDVFISHSSRDKAAADAVCAALEANGIRCWMAPRDISPGQDWSAAIIGAIKAARVMVLIFSQNSNCSEQVKKEIIQATSEGIKVVPLRLQDVPMNEALRYHLGTLHWMDALTPPLEKHLRGFAQKVLLLLQAQGAAPGAALDFSAAVAERPTSAAPPQTRGRDAMALALLLLASVAAAAWAWRADLRRMLAGAQATARASPSMPAGMAPPAASSPVGSHVAGAFVNTLQMKFVRIEAGEFDMGTPESEAGRGTDETLHHVTITKPFLMAATTVTQAQWTALMGANPSYFHGDNLPVETVSWNDAVAFREKLSQREGKQYRLPTEAEWEYACRAGTTTPFNTGPTISTDQANYNGHYTYGGLGVRGEFRGKTTPVASFKPNAWGLYDMHGNVWQWCSDSYGPYQGDESDPKGPRQANDDSPRVLRGGSWYFNPRVCRAGCRLRLPPDYRFSFNGFRLVLDSE